MGWLRRYEHAKPALNLFGEPHDAFAQLVASRQHDPSTLDVEIFRFIVLVRGSSSLCAAFASAFVAICNLSRDFLEHRPHQPSIYLPLNRDSLKLKIDAAFSGMPLTACFVVIGLLIGGTGRTFAGMRSANGFFRVVSLAVSRMNQKYQVRAY